MILFLCSNHAAMKMKIVQLLLALSLGLTGPCVLEVHGEEPGPDQLLKAGNNEDVNDVADFQLIHHLRQVHRVKRQSIGQRERENAQDLFANFGTRRHQSSHRHDSGRHTSSRNNRRGRQHQSGGGILPLPNNESNRPSSSRNNRRGNGRTSRRGRSRSNRRRRRRPKPRPTKPSVQVTLPTWLPHEDEQKSIFEQEKPKSADTRSENNAVRRPKPRPRSNINIPSGQFARIRDGKRYNEGRVEVYQHGRWGLVCDDDWELDDAHVVCKQLGFVNGAQSAMGGSYFGVGHFKKDDILMDQIECQGFEKRLQECPHATIHDCELSEAASVVCVPNTGCDDGWVSGNGICYRIMPQIATYDSATEKCNELEAHLLTIENQAESDFVSDLLITSTNETYFFTAGRKITQDGINYWKWQGTLYRVTFTKWFPGWPPHYVHRQPSNHTRQDCITLARRFYDQQQRVVDVDYYFWNDAPCAVRLPFVCEKVSRHPGECYKDNGTDYRGSVHRTDQGTLCQKWTLSSKINPSTHPNQGLGDHNHCRNPDNDTRPWCWVSVTRGRFGYCSLTKCKEGNRNITVTATVPVSERPNPSPCPSGMFHCMKSDRPGVIRCIPMRWRCDGEEDCRQGEDEEKCNLLRQFRKFTNRRLMARGNHTLQEDRNIVTYANTGLDECARLCLDTRSLVCRSFNFKKRHKVCSLLEYNTHTFGGLVISFHYNYYELISQARNCSDGFFTCRNGKCISQSDVCNGFDDCNDFSDEQSCSTSPDIALRLVGGSSEHEGRVEIRYMGEWGTVCDDKWDIKDATVVCKQMGYPAALKAEWLAKFGEGNGNILLDEVQCLGNESSLQDCPHDPWRTHNCQSYEAAGVVCQVGKVCGDREHQCTNGMCIPTTFVCNRRDDCGDGSDEKECADIQVQLVGGRTEKEGRVEIIRNGIRGTVCDDDWDDLDASVVCKMMGYKGLAVAYKMAYFGRGSGNIWMDNVQCTGREWDIEDCRHAGWAVHNCGHSEDAGVACSVVLSTVEPSTTSSLLSSYPRPTHPSVTGQCGSRSIQQSSPRIVGGFYARYGAYPWQVGISKRGLFGGFGHWCGGTLVSNQWVLSAAHCYIGRSKEMFRIRVGDLDQTQTDPQEQLFEVEEIIKHELYNSRNGHDYDVALIKLKFNRDTGYVKFKSAVQPACLPNRTTSYREGTKCLISGWGRTSAGGSKPILLKAAVVPIQGSRRCQYTYKSDITRRMFCAGYFQGGIDSCQGDSGGPFVCKVNGKYTVMGITSWGRGCGKPYSPGVYTKVSQFVDWINQKMTSYERNSWDHS